MSQALAPQILTKFYDLFAMVLDLQANAHSVLQAMPHLLPNNPVLQQTLTQTYTAAKNRNPAQLPNISDDLAQQALHLYGDLAAHLFALTEPAALDRASPKTLHHFAMVIQIAAQNPNYAAKLIKFLTQVDLDAQILERHKRTFGGLFRYASRSSYMQGALTRILAYQGGEKLPIRRLYNDLSYVQAQIARKMGVPRTVSMIVPQPSNLVGTIKIFYSAQNAVFLPVIYLFPINRRGLYRTGEKMLYVSAHELAHIYERLQVEKWANAAPTDKAASVLPKGVLRWAQNSQTLGLYVPSDLDYQVYDAQLRERHADWFAAQCMKKFKAALK